MATLISAATGNFTASGTWKVSDPTAQNITTATTTALTTSYQSSSTFTPGAITIDGIAVFVSARTGTTGTMTVALDQGGSTVSGTEVSINVSDIEPSVVNGDPGWYVFSFSPVLLLAATAYSVKAKTSSSGQVSLYSTTTTNWARLLRTTTTQAPVAGDTLFVIGENTGPGTGNNFTVTMNETATTDYGPGTDNTVALTISKRGTLSYGTTAATNYYLKLSGDLIVYSGGTLNIGTPDNPIPRDSTAVLEFDPVADGGMGLDFRTGSNSTVQGLSRTSGKNIVKCLLNTDEAAGQTVLGVDTDTGWLSGDEIAIASTTRTATQAERRTLSDNATATEITVSSGLTNAHSGTSPTQAEVILLTRNVKIRSATSTLMTYIYNRGGTHDWDWVEMYYLGENVAGKRGFEFNNSNNPSNIQYCSIHDCEDAGWYVAGGTAMITFSNNVLYNLNTTSTVQIVVEGSSSNVYENNVFMRLVNATGGHAFQLGSGAAATWINNTVTSCTSANGSPRINGVTIGTWSGWNIHSNSGSALLMDAVGSIRGTISNSKIWRNSGVGLTQNLQGGNEYLTLDTCDFWGNSSTNINIGIGLTTLVMKNCNVWSDAAFTTGNGLSVGGISSVIQLENCNFGVSGGHTNGDIVTNGCRARIYLFDTVLASSTEISSQSSMLEPAGVFSKNHDDSSTTHKAWFRYGTIVSEQTIRHTASGFSWRMTPNNTTNKLLLPGPSRFAGDTFKVAVNSGSQVTVSVWVRKDSSYNGNAPRLVLIGGIIDGIPSDVTASLSVGANTWEQLSVSATPSEAGVIEYYVDCDGNAGNIYVDDVSVSQA